MNGTPRIITTCIFFLSLIFLYASFSYGAGVPISLDDIIIFQYIGSTAYSDNNENGIPDGQEVQDDVDLDQNDVSDNNQDDLKTFKSLLDSSLIGVKGSCQVKDIKIAASMEASKIECQDDKPDFLNE